MRAQATIMLICLIVASTISGLAIAEEFLYPSHLEDTCTLRLFDPSTKGEREIEKFARYCPTDYFYDSVEKKFYYVRDKLVAKYGPDFSKKDTWDLPLANATSIELEKVWRDKETNKIRVAFFDFNEDRVKFSSAPNKQREHRVTYKGKYVGDVSSLGQTGVAVAYELIGSNWKLIKAIATNSDACETLGIEVLDIKQSDSTIAPSKFDSEYFDCFGDKDCFDKQASPAIKEAVRLQLKSPDYAYTSTAKGFMFISEVDTDNPGFPAFIYSPIIKKLIPIETKDGKRGMEFTLSRSKEWFSIRTDKPEQTQIFHYDSPLAVKTIAGLAFPVFWIP